MLMRGRYQDVHIAGSRFEVAGLKLLLQPTLCVPMEAGPWKRRGGRTSRRRHVGVWSPWAEERCTLSLPFTSVVPSMLIIITTLRT